MGIKLIYISSNQRYDYNTTSSSEFSVPCADSLYGGYRLKAISIPNTIYTIDNNVNDIFVVETGGSSYIVDMPSNYISDGTTLATQLQTAIVASTGIAGFIVTYSDLTSKLTFNSGGPVFTLNFSTVPLSPPALTPTTPNLRPINNILGFGLTSYTSSGGGILSSTYIVNLTRTPVIFIVIEQANNYLQSVRTGSKYTFMIPNNVNSLYFIDSFFDQTAIFNQFAKELKITLRDENNRIVDIQNIDWYMVLESIC
jgi:hypothetical protein